MSDLIPSPNVVIVFVFVDTLSNIWALFLNGDQNIQSSVIKTWIWPSAIKSNLSFIYNLTFENLLK